MRCNVILQDATGSCHVDGELDETGAAYLRSPFGSVILLVGMPSPELAAAMAVRLILAGVSDQAG